MKRFVEVYAKQFGNNLTVVINDPKDPTKAKTYDIVTISNEYEFKSLFARETEAWLLELGFKERL